MLLFKRYLDALSHMMLVSPKRTELEDDKSINNLD